MFKKSAEMPINLPINRESLVSDTIIVYRSDLSPRQIYQSKNQDFGQNIPNFTTYRDFVADLFVRETFWGQ
jgi:hypothetical protein